MLDKITTTVKQFFAWIIAFFVKPKKVLLPGEIAVYEKREQFPDASTVLIGTMMVASSEGKVYRSTGTGYDEVVMSPQQEFSNTPARKRLKKMYGLKTERNSDCFLTLETKSTVLLQGAEYEIAPFAIEKKFDLLAVTTNSELIETGFHDMTDIIDPQISLSEVYLRIDGKIHTISVDNRPFAAFTFDGPNYRVLLLEMKHFRIILDNPLEEIFISLSGSINIETGETWVSAAPVTLVENTVGGTQSPNPPKEISVVGYTLNGYRSNFDTRKTP